MRNDARVRHLLADQRRNPHQLVIVDPDQIARPVVCDHRVGEAAVHALVVLEALDLQWQLVREVVEQRPEHPVGVRLVIAVNLLGGEGHRDEPEGLEAGLQCARVGLGQRLHQPRPADPHAAGALVRAAQPGRQTTHAGLHLDPARARLDGDRQPVGDDEDAGHGCRIIAADRRAPAQCTPPSA
jgi:hypothetical protein